jgi:hypothetical protein
MFRHVRFPPIDPFGRQMPPSSSSRAGSKIASPACAESQQRVFLEQRLMFSNKAATAAAGLSPGVRILTAGRPLMMPASHSIVVAPRSDVHAHSKAAL